MTDRQMCGTCRFWARGYGGTGAGGPHCDGTISRCVRHAPKQVNPKKYPHDTAVWPETKSTDWCGDWEDDGMVQDGPWRRIKEAVPADTACHLSEQAKHETTSNDAQSD